MMSEETEPTETPTADEPAAPPEGLSLVTTVAHKRGTKLMVRGHVYTIDDAGVIEDVSEEHAAVLLQNITWKRHDPEAAAASRETRKEEFLRKSQEAREAKVGEVKAKAKAEMDAIKAKADAEAKDLEAKDAAEETARAAGEKAHKAELAEREATAAKAESQGDEWPDPAEELGIDKLREMADAYEVEYKPGTQAKTLVKLLNKAMYE